MSRALWIVAAMALPGGLMGCKDSNTTIVFDATASEAKGDVGSASDAGKTDAAADGVAPTDVPTDVPTDLGAPGDALASTDRASPAMPWPAPMAPPLMGSPPTAPPTDGAVSDVAVSDAEQGQ